MTASDYRPCLRPFIPGRRASDKQIIAWSMMHDQFEYDAKRVIYTTDPDFGRAVSLAQCAAVFNPPREQ